MLTPSPVQTTYYRYLTVAQLGMPATTTGWDVDTRIAEDVASPKAGIPFGRAVSQGTLHGDRSAVLGTLSGKTFAGITAADVTLASSLVAESDTDKYIDGDNMAVAIRGDWWVIAADAVAAGGPVYFNSSTGELGASGISNATQILGAIWVTSAPLAVGQLMKTEVGTLAVVRLAGIAAF